jgi:hypothetical protein
MAPLWRPLPTAEVECDMAQILDAHRELARRGAQCAIVFARSQHAEDGSRCRDVFREHHNAYAATDGQDRGVVTRSVDRSASSGGARVPRARVP